MHNNNGLGIVEVNCETDFVSKNQSFQDIVDKAAIKASQASSECISGKDECGSYHLSVDMLDKGEVGDLLISAVGKMGKESL